MIGPACLLALLLAAQPPDAGERAAEGFPRNGAPMREASIGSAAASADTASVEEPPLREQLEGLAPEPRIAYLRHILAERGPDAEIYFLLAVAFHESARTDSALQYYGWSLSRDPGNVKAYVNLGVLFDERGDARRALAMFERALSIDGDDVLALCHASFLLFQQGRHGDAWKRLSRALELEPGNTQARFYLAIFFWESRIYLEAMREWERIIELEPDGYLAARARENIVLLQKALRAPSGSGRWEPLR